MLHNIQKDNHVGVLFYLLYRGRTKVTNKCTQTEMKETACLPMGQVTA